MDVAIGLPNAVPGTTGEQLTEWARRAEARGFSSLGTIDRIAYRQPRAAGRARRGGGGDRADRPLRPRSCSARCGENPVALAKQVASIHALSGGRMTLGIGLGGRDDDYEIAGRRDGRARGQRLDEMLERIREVWEGEEVGPDAPHRPARAGRRRRSRPPSSAPPASATAGSPPARRRTSSPSGARSSRRPGRSRPRGRGAAERRPRLLLARRRRRGGRQGLPHRLLRLARRGHRQLHRRLGAPRTPRPCSSTSRPSRGPAATSCSSSRAPSDPAAGRPARRRRGLSDAEAMADELPIHPLRRPGRARGVAGGERRRPPTASG